LKIDIRASPFLQLLLTKRVITPSQLKEALQAQRKITETGVPIGLDEILLRKGFITAKQLAHAKAAVGRGRTDVFQGYEVLEKVGQGGMGAVYKAKQVATGRLVAIKVLLPAFANEPNAVDRFLREARVLSRLSHPNVVAGIDAGYQRGVYYCVMEFAPGRTLAELIGPNKRLPARTALHIAGQIAAALAHAEKLGVVHRDIKPQNIVIGKRGVAKLMDLGVAKLVGQNGAVSDLTGTGNVMGTPAFMSPEQARGLPDIDGRSDLYSLGLVLYQMLSGQMALMGRTAVETMTMRLTQTPDYGRLEKLGVPEGVIGIVRKMTAIDRNHRYANAMKLLEQLDVTLVGRR
jgi:serine/threonine-protein kinase